MFNRRAEWIWINPPDIKEKALVTQEKADLKNSENRYIYFRKDFILETDFNSASAAISVDGRYQFFLNGALVGRGPARCHPFAQYVDNYDIHSLLKKGKNLIAVLVHTYGRDTSWYELPEDIQLSYFGCGGLFFQGDIESAGRKPLLIDSDESWLFKVSEAWKREVPFGGTGYAECYDFNLAPKNWTGSDFDSSEWENAHILRIPFPERGSDLVPFPNMVERDIPHLSESLILLEKIASSGEVGNSEAPVEFHEIDRSSLLNTDIAPAQGKSRVFILDFGRVVIGRLCFKVKSSSGTIVDFAYGERLLENGSLLIAPAVPGISIPPAHSIHLAEGMQEFEQFEAAGYRYLQLRIHNCSSALRIISLGLLYTCYPTSGRGAFSCSDPLLSRIWQAGAYTAEVCRQDGFIDCPSREQRQWSGDGYIQSLLNYVTEKDTRLVKKHFRQVAETQRPDGMTMMVTTSDLKSVESLFSPDFCLFWLLSIERYLVYTGNEEDVKELFPGMLKAVKWFSKYLDDNHLLNNLPGWTFIDWSEELDRRGEVTVLNALFVAALKAVAAVALLTGADAIARELLDLADKVKSAVNKHLWDEDRGIYVDARLDGKMSDKVSQQANAAVIYFDLALKKRWPRIFKVILDGDRVKLTKAWARDEERPFDPLHDVIMAQPFFCHFLNGAMFKAGMCEEMLGHIRRYWGPMIEESSTCWETWQLSDITSLCHGFSATPAFDLSTYILGVTPLENGYKRFKVAPCITGLDWAKGSVPAGKGHIRVEWAAEDKLLTIKLTVHPSLQAEVELPRGYRSDHHLCLSAGRYEIKAYRV